MYPKTNIRGTEIIAFMPLRSRLEDKLLFATSGVSSLLARDDLLFFFSVLVPELLDLPVRFGLFLTSSISEFLGALFRLDTPLSVEAAVRWVTKNKGPKFQTR